MTFKDLRDIGAGALLKKYQNSPSLLLSKVYPDFNWLPWKFVNNESMGLSNIESEKEYLDWVGSKLNIIEFEDWYKISTKVNI